MDFPLPPVGEGLIEVELTRWLVSPGDAVARGQSLAEVMSDKATMEVPAPFAGTVTELAGAPGAKVKVGELFLRYTPAGVEVEAPEVKPSAAPAPAAATVRNGAPATPAAPRLGPPAAPSVRLLARKLGVDLATVAGSGPAGRVLLDDLTARLAAAPAAPAATAKGPPALDFGVAGTRQVITGLRRKIAEQMVAAKRAPHFTYVDECDFTELVRLREQLKGPLAKRGVKLTYLPFVVLAVARALKEVPVVNATFDAAADELTLHAEYHLGVAVAAPAGLVVPVVRHADAKDLAGVAAEIERLSVDARAGRPKRADLGGGTFTITSIGGIGGLIATPILNAPEVGILAVGKVVRRPAFDAAGRVVPADMAYLSFSFDHRIVDGAVGAHFGNAVIRHLQAPATLLLPGN